MLVSQKSLYALRAIFELAKRGRNKPVKIAEIAEIQAIPPRFLEVILNQLKQAGFVESRRGNEGGYMLARSPEDITVGDVLEFIQGPVGPIDCLSGKTHQGNCPLHENCVFIPMWEEVKSAIENVYNNITFKDLTEKEIEMSQEYVPSYAI